MKLTDLQRMVQIIVINATVRGQWYRARSNGERVTLASLYRRGILQRRVWRTGKSSADNAHEYRPREV